MIPESGDLHKIASLSDGESERKTLDEQQIRAVGYPQPFIFTGNG